MKKVFVGMSGGVDSSLAAAILKESGYDVTGVFIKVWQPDFIECTSKEDRRDAMRVAGELDIPFITLDLEKEYKKGVIDYMMKEYESGRTPNPDVMCNREIKFGAFLRWAKDNKADFIATGHYAITDGKNLFTGLDQNKDQSYFLWTLSQKNLKHILFPIGHMNKKDVRREAEKRGLWTKNKKDSQGLCFIGSIDVKDFLKKELGIKKGVVIDESGNIIGEHDGVIFYTVGERHGFTTIKRNGDTHAFYIINKDIEKNILIVSKNKPQNTECDEIELEDVNWIEEPKVGQIYDARARYRSTLFKVKLSFKTNKWVATPLSTEAILVPGQSLVVYDGNKCLGGGIIN